MLTSTLGLYRLSPPTRLLYVFSPGEVPDTREALLNAFKRLDNDLSLEAQVGTTGCLKENTGGKKRTQGGKKS